MPLKKTTLWNLLPKLTQSAKSSSRKKSNRSRRLHFEGLEGRQLLAVMLDPSFGNSGTAGTTFTQFKDPLPHSIAVQDDGKIVVGSESLVSGSRDFTLLRYNPDGTIDSSFGTNGKVVTDFNSRNYDTVSEILILANGKILAVGTTDDSSASEDFAIARYNTDGSLDATFGTGGKVVTDVNTYDEAVAVSVFDDGSFVVFGRTYETSLEEADILLARYNSNGTLDNSFGTNGIVQSDLTGAGERTADGAVLANGKILVGATVGTGTDSDFGVARFNSNGTVDTNFGVDGLVRTDIGTLDQVAKLKVQADGKIVVSGAATAGSTANNNIAVLRYNANGTLDTTFAGNGKRIKDLGANYEYPYDLALQADGKIVVAGTTQVGNAFSMFLVRLTSAGEDDSSFANSGVLYEKVGDTFSFGAAVTVLANGKIVAATYTRHEAQQVLALLQYTSPELTIKKFNVPRTAVVRTRVTLSATASDPNQKNSTLKFRWKITGPGGYSQTLQGNRVSFKPPKNGKYTITLIVRNKDGQMVRRKATLRAKSSNS